MPDRQARWLVWRKLYTLGWTPWSVASTAAGLPGQCPPSKTKNLIIHFCGSEVLISKIVEQTHEARAFENPKKEMSLKIKKRVFEDSKLRSRVTKQKGLEEYKYTERSYEARLSLLPVQARFQKANVGAVVVEHLKIRNLDPEPIAPRRSAPTMEQVSQCPEDPTSVYGVVVVDTSAASSGTSSAV
eukprot:jgi/Botrbrau1/9254/Bobra.180_1s0012.1